MQRTFLTNKSRIGCLFSSLLINTFLFLGLVQSAFGQTFEDFERAKDLDEKVKFGYFLGSYYVTKDLDSLKIVGERLLEQSKESRNYKAKNYSYQILGAYYIRTSNVYLGMKYLRDSRNYFAETEDLNMVTELSNQIGNGYQYMGKYDMAMKWYRESLLYGYSSSNLKTQNIARVNLAVACAEQRDYNLAIQMAQQYTDWAYEIKSETAIANAYAAMGKICLKQENLEAAIQNFELSMAYARKSSSTAQLAHGCTNTGIVKFLKDQKEASLFYFKRALILHKKVKTLNSILDAYLNLGGAYFELNDYENARKQYQIGLDLAIESEKYNNQVEFYNALIELGYAARFETKDLKSLRDLAEKKHESFISKTNKIDELLNADLIKKRPDSVILTNKSKHYNDKLVLPLFLVFVIVILGQWYKGHLI